MREHAIPQDVVGYKFHIIGNMTLKQFLEVGAGCVAGFLIYTTNLYSIIKWPLITLSVAVGAMAAFVPFEERPLDHWIVTFFKVLYRPTKFFWKKEPKIPDVFTYQPPSGTTKNQVELDLSPYRRERIKEYLVSVQRPTELDRFDQFEQQRVSEIMTTFSSITVEEIQAVKQVSKPSLKLRLHSLRQLDDDTPSAPEVALVPETVPTQAPILVTPSLEPLAIAPTLPSIAQAPLPVSQVAQQVEIPNAQLIKVAPTATPDADTTLANPGPDIVPVVDNQQVFSTTVATPNEIQGTQAVVSNTALPFPIKPTEPNKLVGMVLSPQNDLITDAIIEIKTADGTTARAVKTNALGQFFVTTPLGNGEYTLLIEKDGYSFAPLSISLVGQVIEPLEIRSQG